MKKLIAIAIAAVAIAGCQSVDIETPEWKARVQSKMFGRNVDQLAVVRTADGYTVNVSGYKGDVSEQFPAWTREMWAGIGILGRIAATTINPAASAVPLTSEPANAADVAALVKATNEAKVALENAKAELEKVKAASASSATSGSSSDCADGSCTK